MRLTKSIDELWDESELENVLSKAGTGAGSRGGVVIGKTTSGKPIYQNKDHKAHTGFSKEEHSESKQVRERDIKNYLADQTANEKRNAERKANK